MNVEHLAKEAERLKNDAILQKAFDDVRAEALAALATADADDRTMILRLQQRVAVIEEIRTQLDRYIMQVPEASEQTSPFV